MADHVLFQFSYPSGGDTVSDSVMIDAAVNEVHTASAQVTEHQVETGINVTDNIRPMPLTLSIEGLITDTPIELPTTQMDGVTLDVKATKIPIIPSITPSLSFGQPNGPFVVSLQTQKFSEPFSRVKKTYDILVDAIANGAVFTITTSLKTYENMATTSMPVTRNAGTGNVLSFTMEFRQLRFVSVTEVDSPAAKHKPKNKGKQTNKDADKKEKAGAKSFGAAAADAIGGFLK